MPALIINNLKISYNLKRNSRTKRISIKVKIHEKVEIVAPLQVPIDEIEAFIIKNQTWLFQQLEYFKKVSASLPKHRYISGESIYLLGEKHILAINETNLKQVRIERIDNKFLISIPRSLDENNKRTAVHGVLEKWYRKEARRVILKRLEYFNKYYNFSYRKIFIKDQKTRWGSCSTLGNLNFNWRIIIAPLPIVDYIIVHELCHLKEHNHSSAFWDLVGQQISDYKNRKAWLNKHGITLAL